MKSAQISKGINHGNVSLTTMNYNAFQAHKIRDAHRTSFLVMLMVKHGNLGLTLLVESFSDLLGGKLRKPPKFHGSSRQEQNKFWSMHFIRHRLEASSEFFPVLF